MKQQKNLPYLILLLISILLIFLIDPVTDYLADLLRSQPKIITHKANNYYKPGNFKYLKEVDEFIPYSWQDLKNIFYTIMNRGYSTFTFYCPSEYIDCIKDISTMSNDKDLLTNISDFISPFNTFYNFKVICGKDSNEVTVKIEKLYSETMIKEINQKIEKIMRDLITDEMDVEEKILTIHDYIINNVKYDIERLKQKTSPYQSNTAYGALLEGYALCGGYADAMALFLDRFMIPNFKVESKTHVWNAVYLNNEWLHLDLTWDDPINEINPEKQTLIHKFYLITTKTLEGYKILEHDFDPLIYQELVT